MCSYYEADIVKSAMHITSFNFCNKPIMLGNIVMSTDGEL